MVLGPQVYGAPTSSYPVQQTPANAALLAAAGATVVIASDSWSSSGRLSLNAGVAIAGGLDRDVAEEAITHGAAELLGLGDRLGRVAVGYDADLILLEQGPLGEERVTLVLVDGEVVYEREAQ